MGPRRVSFSELSLTQTIHFQRDPTPPSSDDELDSRPDVFSPGRENGGLATMLHPTLSPTRKKTKTSSPTEDKGQFSFSPDYGGSRTSSSSSHDSLDREASAGSDDDSPPDLYTGISDELAAMMS